MQSLQHQVKEQHFVISMRMLASYEKVNCIHKKGSNHHNPQKTKGIKMREKYLVIFLSRSERIHSGVLFVCLFGFLTSSSTTTGYIADGPQDKSV